MGIIDQITDYLSKFIPKRIKRKILEEYHLIPYGVISYSQEGEDLILNRIFEDKKSGFYIDIGAHHPVRYSNTYKFYLNGWTGLNIDATPGSMLLFRKIRGRDINIEAALSDKEELTKYYIFNEPALNTLSEEVANTKKMLPGFYIKDILCLKTESINIILQKYIPEGQEIDFLTIDIEGLDSVVLKTWEFSKYKPILILLEVKGFDIYKNGDISNFLKKNGYEFYAKTVNTVFFTLRNELNIPQ
jgi:hypothetical protein